VTSGSPDATTGSARPLLTVVRGEPTPEQLAALVAVVSARASAAPPEPDPRPRSLWGRPQLRGPLSPAPGAWRASALPH
jgi:hypothetical protein